jgi:hypothetical protein
MCLEVKRAGPKKLPLDNRRPVGASSRHGSINGDPVTPERLERLAELCDEFDAEYWSWFASILGASARAQATQELQILAGEAVGRRRGRAAS